MENEIKTYQVPEANLPTLQAKLAKLNKKAKKLNCLPVSFTILETITTPVYEKDTMGLSDSQRVISHYVKIHTITVQGPQPKINGWEFIAVLEPTFDEQGLSVGNILRNVPNASKPVPEQYRTANNNCDHCQTQRRRNETFILASDAVPTIYKQVGRNCLRDFLGHQTPEQIAEIAQFLIDADSFFSDSENDSDSYGSRQAQYFIAEEVLTLAAASIRLSGWRSNKTAREYGTLSTSGEVSNWIFDNAQQRSKWKKPLLPIDADKETAVNVVEWLASLSTRPELNDYMYNLSLLGRGATFTTKNFGLACSAIPTYLREMEREINRRKQFESDAASQFVGTIGERSEFTLTLVYTNTFETDFGTTHLYKFKDAAGNVVIWFASNELYVSESQDAVLAQIQTQGCISTMVLVETGMTVNLTARVKAHNTRDNVKQTIITRASETISKQDAKERKKAQKEYQKRQDAPSTDGVSF